MRSKDGPDRVARLRVPHDQHGLLTAICRDDPALVFTHNAARNRVTMTLKQSLLTAGVVVDDSRVGSGVEHRTT